LLYLLFYYCAAKSQNAERIYNVATRKDSCGSGDRTLDEPTGNVAKFLSNTKSNRATLSSLSYFGNRSINAVNRKLITSSSGHIQTDDLNSPIFWIGGMHKMFTSAKSDGLVQLQNKFDKLAKEQLISKYHKIDPNLKFGYTGSFRTGKVGNPEKIKMGKTEINIDDFDIDFWIESDELFKIYGKNLRADVEFRSILNNTPGFEGLRPNKKGFSIKFKPSTSNK
jgi:hypothetical protein